MVALFRRTAAALVVLGLSLSSTASAAPSEDPEALIRQGIELRKKGDDLRAEGYFRRAYELARTPRGAAQLGLVEMALGAFTDADEYLSQALASPDAWVRANRQVLQEALDRARTHLLRIQISGLPNGATITTPTRSAVNLPPDGTFWLLPGETVIRVDAPGYPGTDVKVSGGAGETRQVPVKMVPVKMEPLKAQTTTAAAPSLTRPSDPDATTITQSPAFTATKPSPSRGLRWGGIGVGAVGVAATILGGIVFAQGSTKRDNQQSPTRPYDRSDDNWETFETAGLSLLIGGGALIAGGLAMFLVGRRVESSSSGPTTTSLSGVAGPGFGLLRLESHF